MKSALQSYEGLRLFLSSSSTILSVWTQSSSVKVAAGLRPSHSHSKQGKEGGQEEKGINGFHSSPTQWLLLTSLATPSANSGSVVLHFGLLSGILVLTKNISIGNQKSLPHPNYYTLLLILLLSFFLEINAKEIGLIKKWYLGCIKQKV